MKAQVNTIRSITMQGRGIDVNLYELRFGLDYDKLEGRNRKVRFALTRTSGHGRPKWMQEVANLINRKRYFDALQVRYLTEYEREKIKRLIKLEYSLEGVISNN